MAMPLVLHRMVYIFLSKFVLLEHLIKLMTLIIEINVGLKTLLQAGVSDHEFNGDLDYKFRKIVGKKNHPSRA